MKIRTDFVTNSSSSSFTLVIAINLTNKKKVRFCGQGGSGETGRVDYFDDSPMVTVSPKELATAESVDELIELLTEGVVDGWDGNKIFDKSNPRVSSVEAEYAEEFGNIDNLRKYDAYDFVKEIRAKIKKMDSIKSITIEGEEDDGYSRYSRSYTYERDTGKYFGKQIGEPFESEGGGGDLDFDLSGCDVKFEEDDEEE